MKPLEFWQRHWPYAESGGVAFIYSSGRAMSPVRDVTPTLANTLRR